MSEKNEKSGLLSEGQPPQQQVTVVTVQPVAVQQPIFRDAPVTITLDNGEKVQTRVEYKSGLLTWLACLIMCWIGAAVFFLVGGVVGLIAFCFNDLKDIYHYDPNGNVVGVHKRLS